MFLTNMYNVQNKYLISQLLKLTSIHLALPQCWILTEYPRIIVVTEFQQLEPLLHSQIKTGTIANQIIMLLKISRRALYT